MPRRLLLILSTAVVIVVGAGVWLARGRVSKIRVIAAVPDASGVRPGARVDYRGVQVGSVEAVALSDSMVVLRLQLTRTDIPLRNTDRVAVKTLGLLGDRAIDIVPGAGSGQAWREGDTLSAMPIDTAALRRQAEARAFVEAAINKFVKPDSADTLPIRPPPR